MHGQQNIKMTLVGLQDNFFVFVIAGYLMGTGVCFAAGKAAEA